MIHAKVQKDLVILPIYSYFADKINLMNMHTCLFCMGSNTSPHVYLEIARKELRTIFPDIIFGKEMETEPLYFKYNLSLFHNQVGKFDTNLTAEEVRALFKRIEQKAGRTKDDKAVEIVKLDIDLLMYDELVLKKEDMEKGYVKQLIQSLSLMENTQL